MSPNIPRNHDLLAVGADVRRRLGCGAALHNLRKSSKIAKAAEGTASALSHRPAAPASERVSRTSDAKPALVQHMRIDHRRPHVGVAEQFLHGADVGACFQEVRGEGMAQRVAGRTLGDPGGPHGGGEATLNGTLMPMVTSEYARGVAHGARGLRAVRAPPVQSPQPQTKRGRAFARPLVPQRACFSPGLQLTRTH
jgi:hypothetical protein